MIGILCFSEFSKKKQNRSDTSSSDSGYSTSTFNRFYCSESKVDRKASPQWRVPTTPITLERADQNPWTMIPKISPEDNFKWSAANRKKIICLLDVLRAHSAEVYLRWSWTLDSHHHPAIFSSPLFVGSAKNLTFNTPNWQTVKELISIIHSASIFISLTYQK